MARPLAERTMQILHLLWVLPLISVAELVAIAELLHGLDKVSVHNALRAGEKRGWLASVKLGRGLRMVNRWLYLEKGIAWGVDQGWAQDWWHSANGITDLARMINVVELVYTCMPKLLRSTMVRSPWVRTLHYHDEIRSDTGRRLTRWTLEESDWEGAVIGDFKWLEEGPFVAVVGYRDPEEPEGYGYPEDPNRLYLPVLHLGRFQKRRDIALLRERVEGMMVEHPDWRKVPPGHGALPGAVAICSDGASAAVANRHYVETRSSTEKAVDLGIIDCEGKIIRRMNLPACRWSGVNVEAKPKAVGNIGRAVAQLKRGAYASVNGRRRWRIFRTVATNPGLEVKEIAKLCSMEAAEARKLLRPMVRPRVLFSWNRGYYLLDEGQRLYGDAEGTTFNTVEHQLRGFAKIDDGHRKRHRRHDRGLGKTIRLLREQGKRAFVVQGMCIDYYENGKRRQARPDGFVIVDGVAVAVEYERSATGFKALGRKIEVYSNLAEIGYPIPVLFVTETEAAAALVARSGLKHVAATTVDRLEKGPQGDDLGCWSYWYEGLRAPVNNAPIHAVVGSEPEKFKSWWAGDSADFYEVNWLGGG